MTNTQLIDDLTEVICVMANLIRRMQQSLSMHGIHDFDGEIKLLKNWSDDR